MTSGELRVESTPAACRTLGTGAHVFPEQLSWRRGRDLCAWSLGKATHILTLNNSSDLIVSESIRERPHLAMESGEVSHTIPHQPCVMARF